MLAARAVARHRPAVRAATVAALLLGAPRATFAALPAAWQVHTFAGRITEIEPGGGILACATDGGLLLFRAADTSFVHIADAGCRDKNCLTSNRLTAVSRDADRQYWLGTAAAGVVVYRPQARGRQFGRFFALNAAPGGNLLSDSVTAVEAWRGSKDPTVYVATNIGVGQIDLAGGVESYNSDAERRTGTGPGRLPPGRINDLAVDSLYVWVATDSGVARYGRQPPYDVQLLPDSLTERTAYAVETLGGSVYLGTERGVYTWSESGRHWSRVRSQVPAVPTPNIRTFSVARFSDGRLAVGSEGSVWVFNRFVWSQLSPPPILLLENRRFQTIAVTGDTLWTSQGNTNGEGAYIERLAAGSWKRFQPRDLPPSAVKAMSLDAHGDLWIGTEFGGVARLSPDGTWCIFNGDDPDVRAGMTDPEGHVAGLLADRAGAVWLSKIGQPGETFVVDSLGADPNCNHASDAWRHIRSGERGFTGRYWRIVEDGEGNRFFLSDGNTPSGAGGIDVLSADHTRKANIRGALGGSSVLALAFDRLNGPWSRGYVGVDNLGSNSLKEWIPSGQLFEPDPPSAANFRTLRLGKTVNAYRDMVYVAGQRPVLWIATNEELLEYDVARQDTLFTLGAKTGARPGLLSLDIKDLQLDDLGNLWIATVMGLNRIRLAGRVPGGPVNVEALTTREAIQELNAASPSGVGRLYDPERTLAPLPSEKVLCLAYDAGRSRLYIGTDAGLAVADVRALAATRSLPVEEAFLFPNPVRVDIGQREVYLGRVSEPARVTVYNLEGQVVFEKTAVVARKPGDTGSASGDDVAWDMGTMGGLEGRFEVTSGVYMVRITTSVGSVMRTLVVIR